MEEDEFTEKIDEFTEQKNDIQKVRLSLDEAVKENKINESLSGTSVPRVEATLSETESLENSDLEIVETTFDKPDVEIINSAEPILTEEQPIVNSERKEADPAPPPLPKIAFQEESPINKQKNEKSAETETDICEMPTLGSSVTCIKEIFTTVFQRVIQSSRK